jgi:hypothetical protein
LKLWSDGVALGQVDQQRGHDPAGLGLGALHGADEAAPTPRLVAAGVDRHLPLVGDSLVIGPAPRGALAFVALVATF